MAASVAVADVIHLDDVIVDGSMNIGIDAVQNRSFGFDTMILSENNLRILFEDTSTAASFPTTDWRIQINDSTNGGESYFGVDDVTAGRAPFRIGMNAPTHSLFVEKDTGQIGLKTNNPAVELHISDGDTPTVRLDQSGISGWSPQAWDVAGNESNFFIRDVTNGSKLPFRIRPSAPTSSIDIKSNGDIGMGTASPAAPLHVFIEDTDTAGLLVGPTGLPSINGLLHVEGNAFIAETLEIGSSRERKEKIRELSLDEALGALDELKPVKFHYKQDPESQLGFIAEDVPEIVATANRKSVRPMDFVAVLAKVVQEHERREQELVETIGSQQRELERLAERLSALEKTASSAAASRPVEH